MAIMQPNMSHTLMMKFISNMKKQAEVRVRTSLEIMWEKYTKKKEKLDNKWNDLYAIQKIQEDLNSHRIKVEKYNYSLSKETQNFGSQKGFLEI